MVFLRINWSPPRPIFFLGGGSVGCSRRSSSTWNPSMARYNALFIIFNWLWNQLQFWMLTTLGMLLYWNQNIIGFASNKFHAFNTKYSIPSLFVAMSGTVIFYKNQKKKQRYIHLGHLILWCWNQMDYNCLFRLYWCEPALSCSFFYMIHFQCL